MNAQEALARIKEHRDIHFHNELNAIYITEALDMAIEALEKQIPEKPLDICTPVVTWGICPFCRGELNKIGKQTNRVFKTNAYCMDCGQALDWSDEK